jgi:hypothetical protein
MGKLLRMNMSEEVKKVTTKQAALPEWLHDRLIAMQKTVKDKTGKKPKMQEMLIEGMTAYCDDMEKELAKNE